MRLKAVELACELMADRKGEGIDSDIDSQAAIQAIFSDTQLNSRTVLAAIEAANKLGEENYITINWVKAHNGYSLNERDSVKISFPFRGRL